MSVSLRAYRLGEVLRVKHGFPFLGEFFAQEGDRIVLTPGNFFEKGGFKRTFGKEKYYTGPIPQEYICSKGDLIVAMTEQAEGLLGSTAIVPEDDIYLHNQRIGLISCNDKLLDKLYAYYLLMTKSERKQLRDSSSGTKVKHTSPEKIYDVQVFLHEQKKISSLLWAIDSKIELNNRISAELEAMAKMLYDYWFVQFDFPDENGKPYRASGGEMVWNDELKREIPKGWEVVRLGKLFSARNQSINAKNKDFSTLYYTPIDLLPKKKMTFYGGEDSSQAKTSLQVYEENDVLIGAMRVYFHRVCIAPHRGITRTTTMILSPNQKEYLPFLFELVNQDSTMQNANHVSVGTQQPYVTWEGALDSYLIAIPPESLILEYSSNVTSMIDKVKSLAQESYGLAKLRDWLLPMLMNGQAWIKENN